MSKQLNELWEKLDKEWKWYDYVHSWYLRTIEWLGDLYRNLKPYKLKQLKYFVKFWWSYWGKWDCGYSLTMLHWQLSNLLEGYKDKNAVKYEGQDADQVNLEKLIHHLEIFINEDYGDINEIGIDEYNKRYDDNKVKLLKYFGMIDRFWI